MPCKFSTNVASVCASTQGRLAALFAVVQALKRQLCPRSQVANWLEHYADALDLNVWTSTTVTQAEQDPTTNKWKVTVKRADGTERVFCVKHLIFATGISGTVANIPKIPEMVGSFGSKK